MYCTIPYVGSVTLHNVEHREGKEFPMNPPGQNNGNEEKMRERILPPTVRLARALRR